jgi:hypothetical protein
MIPDDPSPDDREATAPKPKSGPAAASAGRMPAAGPHARPELTEHDKTPGSGMLPGDDDTNPSPTG